MSSSTEARTERRAGKTAAPVTRRTQEERSATTRAELIDAAGTCIARVGLTGSTLAVIADMAGVTSGAVQHHFRTRDELLLAVVDAFGKSLASEPRRVDGAVEPLAMRVKRIVDRYWALFGSRQFLAVMKIWLGTQAGEPLYRAITGRMRWFEARFDREWVELFADGAHPPEYITGVRHVTLGAMRGLALRLSFTVDRGRAGAEVAMLERMVIGALGGARVAAAPKGTPRRRPSA